MWTFPQIVFSVVAKIMLEGTERRAVDQDSKAALKRMLKAFINAAGRYP